MTGRFCLALLVCISVVAAESSLAQADFGFADGSTSFQILDSHDQPDSRAGAHPDHVDIEFAFNTIGEGADGNAREIVIELPPGMAGDTTALPQCPRQIFDDVFQEEEECPTDSQVGTATLSMAGFGTRETPVFNIQPAPDQLGELGERLVGKFPLGMDLRPDGSGALLTQRDLPQGIPLTKIKTELWGVPADHQEGAGAGRQAFLTTPTRCDHTPPAVTVRARSWQEPAIWRAVSFDTGVPLTGCSALGFEPDLGLTLDNAVQDEPTGLRASISNQATDVPDGLASSDIEGATMALPEGMSISPSGLESVVVCADARFALESTQPPDCPAASRVGTVKVEASSLRSPLTGDVFLGEERSGSAFGLLVAAQGLGQIVKMSGELRPDPSTGRLSVELASLPQFPFSRISLQFSGGPRALLATPLKCGAATAGATFTPYSGGSPVERSVPADIGRSGGGAGCPDEEPFGPDFTVGTTALPAGSSTTLVMNLERHPGEQTVSNFAATMPRGLIAALGSVAPCGDADALRGSCPASSRIGSVVASVGSGPEPVRLDGEVSLTGPYHGAPFGMAIALRGVLGPLDVGTLITRGTVSVRPFSGQLAIATDAMPDVVRGVSIRLRSMSLEIDRPGFVRNPTSCAPTDVETTVESVAGRRAQSTSPFAVSGCDALRFRPDIAMALTGKGRVRRGGRPGLFVGLHTRPGGTNLRRLNLSLPGGLKADLTGLRAICARGEAIAGRCAAGAVAGRAIARSPLLRGPLRGLVYVVQPRGSGLPDLWTELEGSGLRLVVRSTTSVKRGHLHTQLVGIPDIPLSRFNMRLFGGRKGLFVLARSLCGKAGASSIVQTAALEGQDQAFRFARVRVRHRPCGHTARRKARGG